MKSVKRRATALLTSSALALGGIFAVAQSSFAAQKPPVVVTFWESHSASNQQGDALAHIVRVFEHQHPNIRIVVHVTTASAKALAAVQAGDPPVMAMIGHGPQYGYEQAGALVNLKPLIYGKNGFPTAQLKGIWPGVWKAEFTPKGQQYLFPADVKVAEFFYNANLWKKAGLKKNPPPGGSYSRTLRSFRERQVRWGWAHGWIAPTGCRCFIVTADISSCRGTRPSLI